MQDFQVGATLADAAQQGADCLLVAVAVGEEAGLLSEAEVADPSRVELFHLGDDVVHLAEGDYRRLGRFIAEVAELPARAAAVQLQLGDRPPGHLLDQAGERVAVPPHLHVVRRAAAAQKQVAGRDGVGVDGVEEPGVLRRCRYGVRGQRAQKKASTPRAGERSGDLLQRPVHRVEMDRRDGVTCHDDDDFGVPQKLDGVVSVGGCRVRERIALGRLDGWPASGQASPDVVNGQVPDLCLGARPAQRRPGVAHVGRQIRRHAKATGLDGEAVQDDYRLHVSPSGAEGFGGAPAVSALEGRQPAALPVSSLRRRGRRVRGGCSVVRGLVFHT
ncbi:hypothetical protein ACWGJW_19045 [Streptomyces nigrescens]